jgi:cytosine/adenosine deaminase-related metal-dependent hydrolase
VYYYGLPANLALAAVTTLPAQVLGLEHRIGYIKEGLYTIYHRKRFMNTNHDLFYYQAGTLVSRQVLILISQ